uniref:Ketoacyl_synth_N domain-containing protein n=1 Tax=Parastrongyloides trichosuri TaxID=131310 RepID=A0A0N4Z2S7_PARTI
LRDHVHIAAEEGVGLDRGAGIPVAVFAAFQRLVAADAVQIHALERQVGVQRRAPGGVVATGLGVHVAADGGGEARGQAPAGLGVILVGGDGRTRAQAGVQVADQIQALVLGLVDAAVDVQQEGQAVARGPIQQGAGAGAVGVAQALASDAVALPGAALFCRDRQSAAQALGQRAGDIALGAELVLAAPFGHQTGGQLVRGTLGHEADGPAGGVAAIEGALRTAQDLDAIDVEDQALRHDRDRIGDLVHIDADGGRVVRGIVLEADAAQAELGRAAAEGRFDLEVGRGVLKLVDVGDALLRQAFAAEDAEGDADVLSRLFTPLSGDDDLVDGGDPIRRRLLSHGGGGTQGRERPGGYADQKTIHRLIPPNDAAWTVLGGLAAAANGTRVPSSLHLSSASKIVQRSELCRLPGGATFSPLCHARIFRSTATRASEGRWCAGANNDAGDVADIAESVGQGAGEEVAVARFEHSRLTVDGDFQAAGNDQTAFLAFVGQHDPPAVRARLVGLVQDLQAAVLTRAELAIGDLAARDVGQFVVAIEVLGRGLELGTEELAQRHASGVQQAFQRADRGTGPAAFDQADGAGGHARLSRQGPLGQAQTIPQGAQARSDDVQVIGRSGHDLGRVGHVVDADPFVGLVRQVEHAGAVGDAVFQPADAVDVLLVIGAGRADELGLLPQHSLDGGGGGAGDGAVAVGHAGGHLEQVAHLVAEAVALRRQPVEDGLHLALHVVQRLLDQEAAVDDHAAGISDAGRGQAVEALGLTAVDGVDVHRRLASALGDDRHVGMAGGHGGIELGFELFHHRAHVADGGVAQEGHGAVGDAALGLDLGPPDAAVADADPVHVQRLRDDDVIDAGRREPAALGQ